MTRRSLDLTIRAFPAFTQATRSLSRPATPRHAPVETYLQIGPACTSPPLSFRSSIHPRHTQYTNLFHSPLPLQPRLSSSISSTARAGDPHRTATTDISTYISAVQGASAAVLYIPSFLPSSPTYYSYLTRYICCSLGILSPYHGASRLRSHPDR